MNDNAQPNSLTQLLSKKGDLQVAETKRARSKSILSPLAAYSHAVFVSNYFSWDEEMHGDGRLVVDLSEKLAAGLDISTTFSTFNNLERKYPPDKALYIAVNCDVIGRNVVSIRINNDCTSYGPNSDFYFEPFFTPFNIKFPADAFIYPIKTLPSRATPDNIVKEALKYPFASDGRPVIAFMLRDPELGDLVKIKQTADILRQKHQAKFLISTGPRTCQETDRRIQRIFADFADTKMVLWNKLEKDQNPYLGILGNATHLVTSGTLSTTSDLFATGKPVYYTDTPMFVSESIEMRNRLFADGAVGEFDSHMLSRDPPPAKIRRSYHEAWDKLSQKFCDDLNVLLGARECRTKSRPVKGRPSLIDNFGGTPKPWPHLTLG